jgi:hypothetical protein
MKFFEINEPYAALIKAQSKYEAISVYNEYVADADTDTEVEEISRDEALVRFSRGWDEDRKLSKEKEIIERFNQEQADVLLITSELA